MASTSPSCKIWVLRREAAAVCVGTRPEQFIQGQRCEDLDATKVSQLFGGGPMTSGCLEWVIPRNEAHFSATSIVGELSPKMSAVIGSGRLISALQVFR